MVDGPSPRPQRIESLQGPVANAYITVISVSKHSVTCCPTNIQMFVPPRGVCVQVEHLSYCSRRRELFGLGILSARLLATCMALCVFITRVNAVEREITSAEKQRGFLVDHKVRHNRCRSD